MSMEERLIEFVAGLRAAGVRISVAESMDSFRAVEEIGLEDRGSFRAALRTTLVKEPSDVPAFDKLFPQYWGTSAPPMTPVQQNLTPDQMRELQDALDSLPQELAEMIRKLLEGQQNSDSQESNNQRQQQRGQGKHSQPRINWNRRELQELMDRLSANMRSRLPQLLKSLLSGESPSDEQLEQVGREAGLPRATHPYQQQAITERMLRVMGMDQLEQIMEQLMRELGKAGVGKESQQQIADTVEANSEALSEQVGQFVGSSIARQVAEQEPPSPRNADLMQRPFQSLTDQEAEALRAQVRRIAAQLRSRASLRYRRGRTGLLDPKSTIRANLRYGGVPVDIRHRHRHLKPKLVLICDVSTSMRSVVEFLLTLVYELQDQVAKARSFAFIDDVQEITQDFAEARPQVAIQRVLDRMPPGYYNTDLGFSLKHFVQDYLDSVDHRTTVIMVGDARNNFNAPRLPEFEEICRRARRVVWFNPESPALWGTGDSDMNKYLAYCKLSHEVGTLAQLADAVDRLLTP